MQDEFSICETIFSEDGGVLSLEAMSLSDRKLYERPIKIIQNLINQYFNKSGLDKSIDPPIFCYVGIDCINSWLRKYNNRAVIGVSSGLVDNILWWANTIMCHPNTYPDLGLNSEKGWMQLEQRYRTPSIRSKMKNAKPLKLKTVKKLLEKAYEPSSVSLELDDDFDDFTEMLRQPYPPEGSNEQYEKTIEFGIPVRTFFYQHEEYHKPLSPSRRVFAEYIATAAICHAFFHELGHYFCGHTNIDTEEISSQLLEFDADTMAFQLP